MTGDTYCMTTANTPNAEWLDAWCKWREAGDHSPGTIYLHRRYVERLAEVYPLATVTGDELAAWMARQPWARATKRSARSALSGFFGWAHGRRRDDNPALTLPKIKPVEPCPNPAPDRAVNRAKRAANDQERLMLLLALHCGLRRAEIAGLHTDHISGGWLRVAGKGQKTRRIPIRNQELAARLDLAPEGYLFPGRYGRHVCPDYVGRRLSRLLGPGWSGHSLRSRYATQVHRGSRDILSVQRLLGHVSPETTQRYVGIGDDDLWAAAGYAA